MTNFKLSNEQVHHMYALLNNYPVKDMEEAQALYQFFQVIRQPVIEFEKQIKDITAEARGVVLSTERLAELSSLKVKGAQENLTQDETNQVNEEAEKKAEPLGKELNEFRCEDSVFNIARTIYINRITDVFAKGSDGQPDRGITGYFEIRLFAQTSIALSDTNYF